MTEAKEQESTNKTKAIEEAAKVIKTSSMIFIGMGGFSLIIGLMGRFEPQIFIQTVIFLFFGFSLYQFKSRIAAISLFLYFLIALISVITNLEIVSFCFISVLAYLSVRAIQATLLYQALVPKKNTNENILDDL